MSQSVQTPRRVKHLFCKFNGGRTPLSVFIHPYSYKKVSFTTAMYAEGSCVKSEQIRRQTFENWPVEFLDKNHLAAAGFYYTNFKDVVCCAFCHVRLGEWKQEDDPFEEHKRWSSSCAFHKGLFVGNKLVAFNNEQSAHSHDVCGCSRGKYHCLYLFFYVCVFLRFLLTKFQCVLYSWTAKRIQTKDT